MSRWILFGLAAAMGFGIVLAPAHFVAAMATTSSDGRLTIDGPSGTLWSGRGHIALQLLRDRPPVPLGRIEWRVYPAGLTAFDVDWRVTGPTHQLSGELSIGGELAVSMDGTMNARFINPFLAPYFIELSGDFDLDAVHAQIEDNHIKALTGAIRWSGGEVVYRLSGQVHQVLVEGMTARPNETAEGMSIVATGKDDEIAMIEARLDQAGWLHLGISRHFLETLGQPWRGDEPAHGIVVEVSEKIL